MALTLRIPESLDQSLSQLAEQENTSKQALIVESIQKMLDERAHHQLVMEGVDYALEHDAQTLERLADS